MNMQITQGPWIAGGTQDAPWVQTADGRALLPFTVGDAILMAAAHDLLAAAQHAKDAILEAGRHIPADSVADHMCAASMFELTAVIDKAKGERA